MSFISQGHAGFIHGNVFKNIGGGRKAYMHEGQHGAAKPAMLFGELADWVATADAEVTKPGSFIVFTGQGGVADNVHTVGTYHFDPTKWYQVTVLMNIDPDADGGDHDGGAFSIEASTGSYDVLALNVGWGIAGSLQGPDDPALQVITIAPGTAKADAHFRVETMCNKPDSMVLESLTIEEFDHDPGTTP